MIATPAEASLLIRVEPKFSRVQPRLPHILKPHHFIARQVWRGELQDAEPYPSGEDRAEVGIYGGWRTPSVSISFRAWASDLPRCRQNQVPVCRCH